MASFRKRLNLSNSSTVELNLTASSFVFPSLSFRSKTITACSIVSSLQLASTTFFNQVSNCSCLVLKSTIFSSFFYNFKHFSKPYIQPEKYQATICHFQTYFSSCPFVEVQHHTLHVACQVLLRNQKHKAKKLLKQLVV